MPKDINRSKDINWKCKCGKDAGMHTTRYDDKGNCIHLYFCNDCWWEYDKQPRLMTPEEVAEKQKQVEGWNRGYK